MDKPSIAIIVTWFGELPGYFPAWLSSAASNADIYFYLFTDQAVDIKHHNFVVIPTTLEKELERAESQINTKIEIESSYKFCDLRAYFGQIYRDYLTDYDYWGYCDIDLAFGDLRSFLTNDVLEKYDRFYQYGHLNVFRNDDKTNHLIDLPGSIYSEDEVFRGHAKTTCEEHFGLNRICIKNRIDWYAQSDFGDFDVAKRNLALKHGLPNYAKQVFYWNDGHALRAYLDAAGKLKHDEFVYLHWQKRKPEVKCMEAFGPIASFIITPNELVVRKPGLMDLGEFEDAIEEWSLGMLPESRGWYRRKKIAEFLKSPIDTKKMWLRQKRYKYKEGKLHAEYYL